MFGCIGRLGCLLVLLVAGAVAWFTHDEWYPRLHARIGGAPVVAESSAKWEPLTPEGSARARLAVGELSKRNGPVYVNVAAGDIAAYALDAALRDISHDASGAEALARDERLSVRAMVNVAELGDAKSLGPVASLLGGKQRVTVRGQLEILSPGHAQFRVDQIEIRNLQLPKAIIERLVGRLRVKERDSTIAADAIPVRVPRELGDIRVAKGHVVLYKTVP